jgi:hypothetical protein
MIMLHWQMPRLGLPERHPLGLSGACPWQKLQPFSNVDRNAGTFTNTQHQHAKDAGEILLKRDKQATKV